MEAIINIIKEETVKQMAKTNGVSEAMVIKAIQNKVPNAIKQFEELVAIATSEILGIANA